MQGNALERFSLKGKVCVITGGAGLLGVAHAEAVLEAGGSAVLLDISSKGLKKAVSQLNAVYNARVMGVHADITDKPSVLDAREKILRDYASIDILINNAANNPKAGSAGKGWSRFESFSTEDWDADIAVGLKGAFYCSQVFGSVMAEKKSGVILNISSDLGIIAPDQRIYRKEGLADDKQPVKPVTYSVVKHGLIGLTRYLATYWAEKGVRVNALCPGGVYNGQEQAFVSKLSNLIPLGRMAAKDEYKSAIVFLVSDASSYMTGSVIAMDGGRTCW